MLEQVVLSIAAKKVIAIAAGGALAASAAVYSQVDVSGGIGESADFGLDQSLHPITTEITFDTLLPSVDAEASTTGSIEATTLLGAQADAGVPGDVRIGASVPVNASPVAASAEVAISSEAGGDASVSAAPTGAQAGSETQVALDAAADASVAVETGVAAVTTDLATEVAGELGLGAAIR